MPRTSPHRQTRELHKSCCRSTKSASKEGRDSRIHPSSKSHPSNGQASKQGMSCSQSSRCTRTARRTGSGWVAPRGTGSSFGSSGNCCQPHIELGSMDTPCIRSLASHMFRRRSSSTGWTWGTVPCKPHQQNGNVSSGRYHPCTVRTVAVRTGSPSKRTPSTTTHMTAHQSSAQGMSSSSRRSEHP